MLQKKKNPERGKNVDNKIEIKSYLQKICQQKGIIKQHYFRFYFLNKKILLSEFMVKHFVF